MSDMEKEKITLLACPFCGGEAEIVQDWIRCIKCGVWTDVPKEEDGLPKSIQAWNTRAKQVDERIVLDVDAVYREILNVQEEIESEHKDISLLASQRRRMAVRIVTTFKPEPQITRSDFHSILCEHMPSIAEDSGQAEWCAGELDKAYDDVILGKGVWSNIHGRSNTFKPKVEETSKISIIRAYIEGYQIGHNDTVESCYGGWEDKAEEYFEEAPKINKEGTQNANT